MTLFTRSKLEEIGFVGWLPWADIAHWSCPAAGGVYVVSYDCAAQSPAGWFKSIDPTASIDVLEANWIGGVEIVYIGKSNNLRRRLKQYERFGSGRPVAHKGGRLIWQLPNAQSMRVAWRETPDDDPGAVEKQMIENFRVAYGKPPFANDPHRLGM